MTHCFYCDQFYEGVEEAETACIQLMKKKNHTSKKFGDHNLLMLDFACSFTQIVVEIIPRIFI